MSGMGWMWQLCAQLEAQNWFYWVHLFCFLLVLSWSEKFLEWDGRLIVLSFEVTERKRGGAYENLVTIEFLLVIQSAGLWELNQINLWHQIVVINGKWTSKMQKQCVKDLFSKQVLWYHKLLIIYFHGLNSLRKWKNVIYKAEYWLINVHISAWVTVRSTLP